MSWCGGGEMRPTPAVVRRTLAIHGYTFAPEAGRPRRAWPLCHLDLEFVGLDQVFAGDAEAAGRHLFDGGILAVALGSGSYRAGSSRLARVGLAADAIHRMASVSGLPC